MVWYGMEQNRIGEGPVVCIRGALLWCPPMMGSSQMLCRRFLQTVASDLLLVWCHENQSRTSEALFSVGNFPVASPHSRGRTSRNRGLPSVADETGSADAEVGGSCVREGCCFQSSSTSTRMPALVGALFLRSHLLGSAILFSSVRVCSVVADSDTLCLA